MEPFSHIGRYLSGSCSPAEKEQLEAWRRASAANEAEFNKLKSIWEAAAPAAFSPDTALAWQKVQARLCDREAITESNPVAPTKSRRWFQASWPMAAAIALFLLSVSLYLLIGSQQSFIPAGLTKTETAAHEKQHILLADGSQVWLNQHSRLHYPGQFSEGSREVYLEGEAFFEVSHQAEKPFTVYTAQSRVQVLGTSFNLKEGKETSLQVKTGRVQFSSKEDTASPAATRSLLLSAGEAAILHNSSLRKKPLPLNYLAWKTGEFIFKDTPLKEVFQALEQHYPVSIQAGHSSLLQCRLNARFTRQPLEEVLKVIALTFQLEYQHNQQKVLFQGNENSCSATPEM